MIAANKNAPEAASAHAPRAADTEVIGTESLGHHLSRAARSHVGAAVCGVLDPCIAAMQGLRRRAGGAPAADPHAAEGHSKPRAGRPGEQHDTATPEMQAPKPRRRLLTWLIYFSVLLAGALAGGAASFELLAKLLSRQSAENQRVEAAMAKQSKSVASNQAKLEAAEAKRSQAEKSLVEAKKKQAEAEKKLETTLKESNALADRQKKLDQVAKLLEQIRQTEASGAGSRPVPASSSGGHRPETARQSPAKTADCTLSSGNIKGMKDCLESFNR